MKEALNFTEGCKSYQMMQADMVWESCEPVRSPRVRASEASEAGYDGYDPTGAHPSFSSTQRAWEVTGHWKDMFQMFQEKREIPHEIPHEIPPEVSSEALKYPRFFHTFSVS